MSKPKNPETIPLLPRDRKPILREMRLMGQRGSVSVQETPVDTQFRLSKQQLKELADSLKNFNKKYFSFEHADVIACMAALSVQLKETIDNCLGEQCPLQDIVLIETYAERVRGFLDKGITKCRGFSEILSALLKSEIHDVTQLRDPLALELKYLSCQLDGESSVDARQGIRELAGVFLQMEGDDKSPDRRYPIAFKQLLDDPTIPLEVFSQTKILSDAFWQASSVDARQGYLVSEEGESPFAKWSPSVAAMDLIKKALSAIPRDEKRTQQLMAHRMR